MKYANFQEYTVQKLTEEFAASAGDVERQKAVLQHIMERYTAIVSSYEHLFDTSFDTLETTQHHLLEYIVVDRLSTMQFHPRYHIYINEKHPVKHTLQGLHIVDVVNTVENIRGMLGTQDEGFLQRFMERSVVSNASEFQNMHVGGEFSSTTVKILVYLASGVYHDPIQKFARDTVEQNDAINDAHDRAYEIACVVLSHYGLFKEYFTQLITYVQEYSAMHIQKNEKLFIATSWIQVLMVLHFFEAVNVMRQGDPDMPHEWLESIFLGYLPSAESFVQTVKHLENIIFISF